MRGVCKSFGIVIARADLFGFSCASMHGSDRWRQERLHSRLLGRERIQLFLFLSTGASSHGIICTEGGCPAVEGSGVLRSSVGGNRKHAGLGCGGRSRRQRFIGKHEDGHFVSLEHRPQRLRFIEVVACACRLQIILQTPTLRTALTSPSGLCSASACHG